MAAQRPYGSGSLLVVTDAAGRESWYGKWRTNGRQVKRRIGPVRNVGARDGLTRRQAEAGLRRLIAETPATRPAGERLTIAELGERYVRQLEAKGRKRSTLVAVRMTLRVHLVPFFGDRAVASIRAADVESLMLLMRSNGCGSKSIRNYLGTLSALFNYAQRKRLATANPVREVDLPAKEHNEDVRFLEPREVDALAAAACAGAYEAIDRALYLTAAMIGLRQGELLALRWRDVDWKAGRVRVRQSYVLGEYGTPKSRRSTRSIPMADRLAGELDRLSRVSPLAGDETLVFADPLTAEPLQRAALLRRYRKALAAAQLDVAHRFHDLRHTFGTRMAAAGVPMRTLQEWMGHRDVATTQIYADYAPSAQEAAYIEAAFGDAPAFAASVEMK